MFNQGITSIVEMVVSICVSFGIIAAAIHWFAKGSGWVIGKATKKSTQLSAEMVEMHQKCDEHCEHVDECLDRDNKRLQKLEECLPLLLKGMKQLITHELDGNHVDKLEEVRDEMDNYLINR